MWLFSFYLFILSAMMKLVQRALSAHNQSLLSVGARKHRLKPYFLHLWTKAWRLCGAFVHKYIWPWQPAGLALRVYRVNICLCGQSDILLFSSPSKLQSLFSVNKAARPAVYMFSIWRADRSCLNTNFTETHVLTYRDHVKRNLMTGGAPHNLRICAFVF